MLQLAGIVYRPSSSEPIMVPGPFLCQRKPATTQSAVRWCLILTIARLPGDVRVGRALGDDAVEAGALEDVEPVAATPGRSVDGVSRTDAGGSASSRSRRGAALAERRRAQVASPSARQSKATYDAGAASASISTRDAAGWMRSSRASKSRPPSGGDDDLAVEHEPRVGAAERPERALELGEVPVQRLEVAALDVDLGPVPEDEGPEPVPLRLVDPPSPSGISGVGLASIGSIGGSIGNAMDR